VMPAQQIDYGLFDAFVSDLPPRPAWTRNRTGNLVRRWGAWRFTVFERGRWFGWSMCKNRVVRFSSRVFETEQLAIDSLMNQLRKEKINA